MKKVGTYIGCLLLFMLFSLPAHAQFEGKIAFSSYDVASDGSQTQNDQFSMYLTKDRILLEGSNQYKFAGGIQTEGVLVRLDFQDFVLLTGDTSVLKISKKDIDAMMNMFGGSSSAARQKAAEHQVDYEKTGETREIKGYQCEKYIFTDDENPNETAEVWMTDQLNINWGMLAEPWGNSDLNMMGDEFSLDLIFKDGLFPLRIEGYESGNLRSVAEVTEISKTDVAKAMVQVPQGVKVLSFQDYLFNKMSQQ